MTKEEIKTRASVLHTLNHKGVECVSKLTAITFAEHVADITRKETLFTVCKCLVEMGVVSERIVDELYEKAKTMMLSK